VSEPRPGPTVVQVVLCARLQQLREAAKMSREQAAKVIRVGPATIHRMEKAKVALKIPYVKDLLEAYGLPQADIDDFVNLAEEANQPGWWQRFHDVLPDWFSAHVALENAASLIWAYEPHCVPGLLQTEDYTRTLLETGRLGQDRPDEVDRHVALRMERQELLARADAPRFWVILDEAALRRQVGTSGIMRDQIDRLMQAAQRANVTLQIIEFGAGYHSGAHGPVVLFRFEAQELPDMVYLEHLTGAVYLDRRAEVAAHHQVLEQIALQAAPVGRTEEILKNMHKEF
jgi:transcriptional regulator with XRE-family HTH domain